jgi:uncharacterized protein (DUF2267 family)
MVGRMPAQQAVQDWLAAITEQLGVPDREYAYRLLRAWLHTVRDRLPVGQVVQLAAELPEPLRGVYYEGWEPADAPLRLDVETYVGRFALEARVPCTEVQGAAVAVSEALRTLFSPGQLDVVFGHLSRRIRELLEPAGGFGSGRRAIVRVLPGQELAHAGQVTPRSSL